MAEVPQLFIPLKAVHSDNALLPGNRGERKILVTGMYADTEEEAHDSEWAPKSCPDRCPVQTMSDTELAVFSHGANQERHYHRNGTEIYVVLEGEMVIEAGGREYLMSTGDVLVVNPGTIHRVKSEGTEFLCQVITVNCGGQADKVVV